MGGIQIESNENNSIPSATDDNAVISVSTDDSDLIIPTPIVVDTRNAVPFTGFVWDSGGDPGNSYQLIDDYSVQINAAPYTDQWYETNTAALMTLPVSGEFIASVKVEFSPAQNYQTAGIGVRWENSRDVYIRVVRQFVIGSGIGWWGNVGGTPVEGGFEYYNDFVYLRIRRIIDEVILYYSIDNVNWVEIASSPSVLPSDIELYLVVYSSENDESVSAVFSEFSISNE